MPNMPQPPHRIHLLAVVVLSVFALTACSARHAATTPPAARPHSKHVLYIGLNDGADGERRVSADEAKRVMRAIGGKYADGFTLYEATGYWRGSPDAEMEQERTLVCVFIDLPWPALRSIMDEALRAFNQRAVLLEATETRSLLYEGRESGADGAAR